MLARLARQTLLMSSTEGLLSSHTRVLGNGHLRSFGTVRPTFDLFEPSSILSRMNRSPNFSSERMSGSWPPIRAGVNSLCQLSALGSPSLTLPLLGV